MYCRNCGAKIPDGSKFCSECGTLTAPETPRQEPAQPDPIKINRRPATGGGYSMPTGGGAYAGGNTYKPAGGAYPGGNNPAPVPDYDSRTVLLDVSPAAYRNEWEANPSPGPGKNVGSTPYPAQPAGPAQYGDPYGRQTPPRREPQKAKRSPLVVVLIVLGVLLVVVAALVIIFTMNDNDSTNQTITSGTDTVAEVGASTTADQTSTQQGQSVDTTASQNAFLTDAQAQSVMEKTVGFWTSDDNKRFIGVTRMDGGLYYFTSGYWYSEADLVGYLQQPMTGDPNGTVSVHLYFEGYVSEETGFSMPSVDDDMQFDLSDVDADVIKWNFYGEWVTFRYGGKTMEEAMPSDEEFFG